MQSHSLRFALVPLALLLVATPACALDSATLPAGIADAMAQGASPQAVADYRRKLAEYEEARAAFDAEAKPYWNAIYERRKIRNAKRRDRVATHSETHTPHSEHSGRRGPSSCSARKHLDTPSPPQPDVRSPSAPRPLPHS